MKEDDKGYDVPTREDRARASAVRERAKTGLSFLPLFVYALCMFALVYVIVRIIL